MRSFLTVLLVILCLAAIAVYSSFFIVHQTEQAMVLEFGKPQRVIDEPGLNWLIPFVQTVEIYDKRLLELDTTPQEVILSDKKRLVVDTFARYRIVDPLLFYQAVRNELTAGERLKGLVEASMRRVSGSSTFSDLVRDKREPIMREITRQVGAEAKAFGIEIVDVRIKRADVPEQNQENIYARMRTERQREASEYRAQGEEESRRIKASADREVVVIKATASQAGERVRGEGDAARNAIFAEAYQRDPEFFAFYRTMQAYEQSLKSGDTRMLLSPDSDFFRYFNDPKGGKGAPTP